MSYQRMFLLLVLITIFGSYRAVMAQTGAPTLVSANIERGGSGNGESFINSSVPRSALSADGRFVAFESDAPDLAPGIRDANFASDVFVRDLQTGAMAVISLNQSGTGTGNGGSGTPFISGDGRFVAFDSSSSDLVPGDTNGNRDIFVRDLQTGTTTLVTVNVSGTVSKGGPLFLTLTGISADGRFVLFTSEADDLVPNDQNDSADLFVRDLVERRTILVSVNRAGLASGNRTSLTSGGFFNFDAVISANGQFVAFTSFANDLVDNDNICVGECNGTNGLQDIFVRDLVGNMTTLVSVNSKGSNSGNGPSQDPVISADGRVVAFRSFATDLVTNDRTENADIYARDLTRGSTTLVSVNRDGTNGGTDGRGNGLNSFNPVISANGRFVAFSTVAVDLVSNKRNLITRDVFVRDLEMGTTTLASVNQAGTDSPSTADDQFGSTAADFSADGRFLLFVSNSPDLVPGDNNRTNDIFLRDLTAGVTKLVSRNQAGTGSGNGSSLTGDISSDGKVVAFDSIASDLVTNDNNSSPDVFASVASTAPAPNITSVKYNPSGKLTVRGENFDVATKLFVDSREQTASFKTDGRLIVKKLKLSAGTHEIRVVNKDGQISTSTLVVNR